MELRQYVDLNIRRITGSAYWQLSLAVYGALCCIHKPAILYQLSLHANVVVVKKHTVKEPIFPIMYFLNSTHLCMCTQTVVGRGIMSLYKVLSVLVCYVKSKNYSVYISQTLEGRESCTCTSLCRSKSVIENIT